MLAIQLTAFKLDFYAVYRWIIKKEIWFSGALFIGVIISSLAVSYQKHWARDLSHLHQQSMQESNDLQVEWRQLLVEQSTWGATSRVQGLAIQQFGMTMPKLENVVLVKV